MVLIIHKHEQIFDASFKSKIMFMKALYTLTVVITCIIFHANAYSQGNYFAATNFGSHSKEVNYTGVDKESLASPEMGFIGKEIEKTVTVIKDGFDGINEPKNAHAQLWGMTALGGAYGQGTIYKLSLSGDKFDLIYSFNGSQGAWPYGNLTQANNKLYGMTFRGGTNNGGVLFSLNLATEEYAVLVNFDAATGTGHSFGTNPTGSLLLCDDGLLYGTTAAGGNNQAGVLFSFNPASNRFNKLSDFNPVSGIHPITPVGSLLQGTDGLLYGLTYNGGYNTNDRGVLYSFNRSNKAMQYWEFGANPAAQKPRGSLIQTGIYLYGTTFNGGKCDSGTVFRFNLTTHTFQNNLEFCGNQENFGSFPQGKLVEIPTTVSSSDFYGLTSAGGTFGKGNIFRFNSLVFGKSYPVNFNGLEKGSNPDGSLINTSNGRLYGTTLYGGKYDKGTVFYYDPSTAEFKKIHTFSSGSTDGGYPHEDVLELLCAPPSPDSIGGPGSVCKGSTYTYSVRPVKGATSYKWSIPQDAVIVGSSTGTSINVKFGAYGGNVTAKASNGTCLSFSIALNVTTKSCLIAEANAPNKANEFHIFPNPSGGIFNITINSLKQEKYLIDVTDLSGRKVMFRKEISSMSKVSNYSLDLSKLATGFYIVRLNSKQKSESFKIEIQK
ncbi:MAG TPA: T9SS type A sorting domain-containing protein [Panacibacter sp.]|nr:T9SS type A sorting domain-containing protein [Panacibacter sp.]HNP46188.1 T9SS type A sorting domain-containing protein [Panacibacter sp.]